MQARWHLLRVFLVGRTVARWISNHSQWWWTFKEASGIVQRREMIGKLLLAFWILRWTSFVGKRMIGVFWICGSVYLSCSKFCFINGVKFCDMCVTEVVRSTRSCFIKNTVSLNPEGERRASHWVIVRCWLFAFHEKYLGRPIARKKEINEYILSKNEESPSLHSVLSKPRNKIDDFNED